MDHEIETVIVATRYSDKYQHKVTVCWSAKKRDGEIVTIYPHSN